MTVSTTPWDATVNSANHSTTSTPRGTSETPVSVNHVPVTQLVLKMAESVTVTLIFLWVSLLVSVGANCMWKESVVTFVKKASMIYALKTRLVVNHVLAILWGRFLVGILVILRLGTATVSGW